MPFHPQPDALASLIRDNLPGPRIVRLLGRPGSRRRRKFWAVVRRQATKALVLFGVVALLAQNCGLRWR